jgi:ribose 1,5-bisphosphokinase PhnN
MFAVVLSGPPGAGKTSVLTALADALADDDLAHGVVDGEALVWAHPAPSAEEHGRRVATVCRLHREAGHRLLLVAQTVETDEELARLLGAVGADDYLLVRLEAGPATLAKRITEREPEGWSGLSPLVDRAKALAATMPAIRGFELVLRTEGERPEAVARRIREARPSELTAPGVPA